MTAKAKDADITAINTREFLLRSDVVVVYKASPESTLLSNISSLLFVSGALGCCNSSSWA